MSDAPDEAQVRALARKHALQNAVQHEGAANPGAVIGRIMGEAAELRPHSQTIMPWIQAEVRDVNALAVEAQRAELEAADPSALQPKEKKKTARHPFKTLPGFDDHDRIVMRFAPNPNGPATLGHSRGMVTMAEYKRIAEEAGKEGVLVLRYDDTDPQVKPPYLPAYDWIKEDYAWLGALVDRVVIASDRIERYHEVAADLVRKDAAYVCFCSQADAKAFRDAGKPCPHRDVGPDQNLEHWNDMLEGKHADGTATLRIKTQVDHKDPALRDWVGMRIVSTPHPRVGDRHKVWPMLDFESAVEDHLQGVTHIIRGKDLRDSTKRQEYLYQHMGWTYPHTLYWGRVRLDELGSFSSSGMRADIKTGRYTGWDDPRLPTLRAFRRRGIRATALRNFWVGMGLSEKDVAASLLNLYAENERLVEPEAPRLFFVPDAIEVDVSFPAPGDADDDVPRDPDRPDTLLAESPVHPDHPERGMRTHRAPLRDGVAQLCIARADLATREDDDLLRLKDLGNIRITGRDAARATAEWAGDDLEAARKAKAPIIQWLPVGPASRVPCIVLRPEPSEEPAGIRHTGFVERSVLDLEPDVVAQFERYGFVRLEQVDDDAVHVVFAHR